MARCALALLGLLALPLTAAAQDRSLLNGEPPPERLPESRFSVTPYVGARVPYTTGDIILTDNQGTSYLLAYQRGGGPMAGVDVTARVAGPVHFLVGAAYSASRTDVLRLADANGDSLDERRTSGAAYWFARAGVQVRLADPTPDNRRFHPSALITVAPALVVTDWGDTGFGAAADESSTSFALNLGADAAARIAQRPLVVLGRRARLPHLYQQGRPGRARRHRGRSAAGRPDDGGLPVQQLQHPHRALRRELPLPLTG